MTEQDNSHSLILRPDVALGKVSVGPNRFLSEMVGQTLALVRQQLAAAGLAEELFEKGNECFNGDRGTAEDQSEAVSWYLKAAGLGHVHAQYLLGQCYDEGLGVPEDDVEAAKWYRRAAEQGHEHKIVLVNATAGVLTRMSPTHNSRLAKATIKVAAWSRITSRL